MIPLWKGKNPIYFGVITIIPFDNLYRRAYFVMHTFLVPFQICAPVYFSWMSGARLSYIDTFSHLVTNIIKGPFELMASLCVCLTQFSSATAGHVHRDRWFLIRKKDTHHQCQIICANKKRVLKTQSIFIQVSSATLFGVDVNQGSPNQAKRAAFSPYIGGSRPPSTTKRN